MRVCLFVLLTAAVPASAQPAKELVERLKDGDQSLTFQVKPATPSLVEASASGKLLWTVQLNKAERVTKLEVVTGDKPLLKVTTTRNGKNPVVYELDPKTGKILSMDPPM